MRDDFREEVKRILAARVGNFCSNPNCRALTSGPQNDTAKALNVGVAAHITAAAQRGPRYDPSLSSEQRCHPNNGIWLCQTCAKLADNDAAQFPTDLLRAWKTMAEHHARTNIGKTALPNKLSVESRTAHSVPISVPEQQGPKHNIKFVGARAVGAHAGTKGNNTIYESPQDDLSDFKVFVACFRNEAVVGLNVHQPELKAHIIFKDKDGNEITDVPRAVWLDHYGESVPFGPGQKKCLIIFLLGDQKARIKLWNESYRTDHSWMSGGGPHFRIRNESIATGVAFVEVNLLSHDTCVVLASFVVEERETENLPRLVLTSVSTGESGRVRRSLTL